MACYYPVVHDSVAAHGGENGIVAENGIVVAVRSDVVVVVVPHVAVRSNPPAIAGDWVVQSWVPNESPESEFANARMRVMVLMLFVAMAETVN